jgi:murein L,D-transpeptidase YcbB/YkuD
VVFAALCGGGASAASEPGIRAELQHLLLDSPSPAQNRLVEFYETRGFRPVWSGDDDARDRLRLAIATLGKADDQGLRASDYLTGLRGDDADAAHLDIDMTDALLRYAKDVSDGRLDPGKVYKDIRLAPRAFDAGAELVRALAHDDLGRFLNGLPTPDADYRGLVAGLAAYRAIAAAGGWRHVTAGDAPALAARLSVEDPVLAAIEAPNADDVHDALLRYEARNGLALDANPGPAVVAALNVPVAWRIKQILANLERRRWLRRTFESRYIVVNAPDQTVSYIDDGKTMLISPVVIGTKALPTPILRTLVKAVVVNPPWDIPDSIVAQALLPHLRKSPGYLAERNLVLADGPADDPHGVTVDWGSVNPNAIPFQVQQPPGPGNALGALMLDMPNPLDVYLHDTPNKGLFALDDRQKSHGCVRVQNIFALASLALTGDADDGMDKLKQAVASGSTQRLALDEALPVYFLYRTAIAMPDGTIGFRPDIYGRDKRLIALLDAKPPKAKPLPHAAETLASRE